MQQHFDAFIIFEAPFVDTENSKPESLWQLPVLENSLLILLETWHMMKAEV